MSIVMIPGALPQAVAMPSRPPVGATVSIQAAPFKGFGYVQYAPLAAAGSLFQAGARVPLAMPVGAPDLDTLGGPFAGWSFWNGTNFAARAVGDAYDIRLTLVAQSAVAGGAILLDATVNGATAPIETVQAFLGGEAGVAQILSFHVKLYPKAAFVAGGAQIYLTPDVPVTITNSKLIIEPTNAG